MRKTQQKVTQQWLFTAVAQKIVEYFYYVKTLFWDFIQSFSSIRLSVDVIQAPGGKLTLVRCVW